MAIYHFSTKAINRSAGRSATAAAAYRAGELVLDQRTGEAHDYRRRQGVVHREVITPEDAPAWALDRVQLWNRAEAMERRKDARVAREYELALPAELNAEQRRQLTVGFGRALAKQYGVAVDVAIHQPHRGGDPRNHHAHLLATTRRLTPEGFGGKAEIELSDKKLRAHGKPEGRRQVGRIREAWARYVNRALERAGVVARVDHRSLKSQGIERVPQVHLGPKVMRLEKRGLRTGHGEQARAVRQANAQLEQLEAEQLALEVQRRQEAALQAKRQQQLEAEWQSRQALLGPAPATPAPRPPEPPRPEPGQAVERAAEQTAAAAPLSSLPKPEEPDPIDLAWEQFEAQNRQARQREIEAQKAYQQFVREAQPRQEQARQAEPQRQAGELRQRAEEAAPRPPAAEAEQQRPPPAKAAEQMAAGRAEALQEYAAWKAQRERQAPVPSPRSAAEAEQQRLERLTAQELGTEIQRLTPPPVEQVLRQRPEVAETRAQAEQLRRQAESAYQAASTARYEAERWRTAHGIRARLHDAGLSQPYLAERECIEREQTEREQRLRQTLAQAEQQAREAAERLRPVVLAEQAPARTRVAGLEKLRQQKAAQEQAQAREARALDDTLEAFELLASGRRTHTHGYTDDGRHWKATPVPLRRMVEQFNGLPKEAREAALGQMRAKLAHDAPALERLRGLLEQYEQARQRSRGLER